MNRIRRIREQYERGEHAETYANKRWTETRHARKTHKWELQAVQELLHVAEGHLEGPLQSILDLPCGNGRFQPLLQGHASMLIQGDLAHSMLQRRLDSSLQAMQASLLNIPLKDNAVNLSFCFRVLHHFPEPDVRQAIFAELSRVSRHFALVSYYDASAFPHLRDRIRRRKRTLTPVTHTTFDTEVASAGFRVIKRCFRRRWFSFQVLALLEKID